MTILINQHEIHKQPREHVLNNSGVSFKGAALFLVAVCRFKHKIHVDIPLPLSSISSRLPLSTASGNSLNVDHHKDFIQVEIQVDPYSVPVFDPAIDVHILSSLVQNKDIEKLQSLGGLPGLASYLHTDLSNGLPLHDFVDNRNSLNITARKKAFGENAYPRKQGKTILGFLWEAFTDFTLIILMCCAALSLGFGIKTQGPKQGWYDGVSIAFAVLLVVVVTAFSNFKQSRQFQKLAQKRDDIKVHVVRNGSKFSLPVRDLIVGDIVHFSIGDQLPADGLLVQCHSLTIDESSLTGESDYYYPDPEHQPFLHAGSMVQDGYGSMVVTSVGVHTEWGRMMELLSTDGTSCEPTPLQERLTKLATLIGYVGMSVAALVLIVLLVFYFSGHSEIGNAPRFQTGVTSATEIMNAIVHIFSIVVTIIVVAVPEGLPLAVTLSLAYSMRKMMADNALVRRLAACETMGSATIICSDKTGTLTMNEMTVLEAWVAGKKQDITEEQASMEVISQLPTQIKSLLFQGIAQNTMATVNRVANSSSSLGMHSKRIYKDVEIIGSPTEKAILRWGLDAGMDFRKVHGESVAVQMETFNSTKKRGGVAVRTPNDAKIIVHWKGAAEIILSMCNKWVDIKDNVALERPVSDEKRVEFLSIIESMASCSLRCLAFAYLDITEQCHIPENAECGLPKNNLVLLAVVGMKDPCRPGVKTAVETVKAAGVKVMMVTGDNLATAKAIATDCGILSEFHSDKAAVVGDTFRNWGYDERQSKLRDVTVVARALPSDKLLIVETLRSMGEVVAVTGDGTNDAPALHSADIGLSMGIEGTEVAKLSSDIVILDDNFTSIINVVRWGRSIYFNIQKFLQFQLTVNVAALIINFLAAVTSGDVPLTAVQLLWVNLIMDTLGALALATEPPTKELLTKPPVCRKEHLVTKAMWKDIICQAAYQVTVLLTLQFSGVKILGLSGKPDAEMINRTVIFNTFVLCQLFNEVNARQPNRLNIFHGLRGNHVFIGIVATTLVLQVMMVEFLAKFAGTVHLNWQYWLVCTGLALFTWPVGLLAKVVVPLNTTKKAQNVSMVQV